MKLVEDGVPQDERSRCIREPDRLKRQNAHQIDSAVKPPESRADSETVRKLLDGDEATYDGLVARYNDTMISLARAHVPNRAVAEEVVQEAWLALLQGLGGFKRKSSLKTWLFGILINRAKTRGIREGRTVSFSALDSRLGSAESTPVTEAISESSRDHTASLTSWGSKIWAGSPEDGVLMGEVRVCLETAIGKLSPAQRIVLVLRDIEGWSSGEVCDLLQISSENQRVRLHRARLRIRDAIHAHFGMDR